MWKVQAAHSRPARYVISGFDNANETRLTYSQEPSLRWCFFVLMGGIKVHVREICPERLRWYRGFLTHPPIPEHATLTAKGVIRLYKAGHNINISGETIKDRSKQNTLQKCFLVGQVGWMALQCVVRKHYGLPLTLLEVHTMVHVVCTMTMYAFWLKVSRHPELL